VRYVDDAEHVAAKAEATTKGRRLTKNQRHMIELVVRIETRDGRHYVPTPFLQESGYAAHMERLDFGSREGSVVDIDVVDGTGEERAFRSWGILRTIPRPNQRIIVVPHLTTISESNSGIDLTSVDVKRKAVVRMTSKRQLIPAGRGIRSSQLIELSS
jgi:hypothetical protein